MVIILKMPMTMVKVKFVNNVNQKGAENIMSGRQRARESGSVGGKISKRGPGFKYRYNGKVYKIKELAELFGVTYETARQKVKRLELEKVQ